MDQEFPVIYVSNGISSIRNIVNDNIAIESPLIFDTSIREPETHNDNPISIDDKIKCVEILKDNFKYSQITITTFYNKEINPFGYIIRETL